MSTGLRGTASGQMALERKHVSRGAHEFPDSQRRLPFSPCDADVEPRPGLVEGDHGNAARAVGLCEWAGDANIVALAGKTAIKASLNKYVEGQAVGSLVGVLAGGTGPHPVSSLVNATSRLWLDLNGDFVPQCDLTNIAANNECLAVSNPGFGSTNTNALRFDREAMFGWGRRGYNWELGLGVQREINLDVFNLFNGNAVTAENPTFTAFRQPTAIMLARFVKVSAQFDF